MENAWFFFCSRFVNLLETLNASCFCDQKFWKCSALKSKECKHIVHCLLHTSDRELFINHGTSMMYLWFIARKSAEGVILTYLIFVIQINFILISHKTFWCASIRGLSETKINNFSCVIYYPNTFLAAVDLAIRCTALRIQRCSIRNVLSNPISCASLMVSKNSNALSASGHKLQDTNETKNSGLFNGGACILFLYIIETFLTSTCRIIISQNRKNFRHLKKSRQSCYTNGRRGYLNSGIPYVTLTSIFFATLFALTNCDVPAVDSTDKNSSKYMPLLIRLGSQ